MHIHGQKKKKTTLSVLRVNLAKSRAKPFSVRLTHHANTGKVCQVSQAEQPTGSNINPQRPFDSSVYMISYSPISQADRG